MENYIFNVRINELKLKDAVDLFNKYDKTLYNKLHKYITTNIGDFDKYVEENKDKRFKFDVSIKSLPTVEAIKIYDSGDHITKKSIIDRFKEIGVEPRVFAKLLAKQKSYPDDMSLIEKAIGKTGEKVEEGLKWLAKKDIGFEGSPETAEAIRTLSGSTLWRKLYGGLYDILPTNLQKDPRGKEVFTNVLASVNPFSIIPETVASVVERPSVLNVALSYPIFRFAPRSIAGLTGMAMSDIRGAYTGQLLKDISKRAKEVPQQVAKTAESAWESLKKQASNLKKQTLKETAKIGDVILQSQPKTAMLSEIMKGKMPPTMLIPEKLLSPTVLKEMKSAQDVMKKQFEIKKFLENKGLFLEYPVSSQRRIISDIINPNKTTLPQEVKKWLKEDKLTSYDLDNLYKLADKNIISTAKMEDIENIIKKTKIKSEVWKGDLTDIDMPPKLQNALDNYLLKNIKTEYTGSDLIKDFFRTKKKSKYKSLFRQEETPTRLGLPNIPTTKEELKNMSLMNTLINKKIEAKDIVSLKDKLTKAIFDQNIELASNRATRLYSFYTEPAKIYNKAIYSARPTLEKIGNIIRTATDEAYANNYLFYKSLIEEHELGNRWLYNTKIFNEKTGKYEILTKAISKKELEQKLIDLDKEYALYKYKVQDYDPKVHTDIKAKIDNFKKDLDDLASDMSKEGIKMLKEMPFVDEKFLRALECTNRKYYFSYFMPEDLQDILGQTKDVNVFGASEEVVKKLHTPFIKQRKGGWILPDKNVFESFYKGLVLKEYALEKFKVLKETVDDIGLYPDELTKGLKNNPKKIERILDNITLRVKDLTDLDKRYIRKSLESGNFDPLVIGYKEIKIPFVNENNKLIAKNVYLPLPIVEFLDDKVKTFSKTIFEHTYENIAMLVNKLQITAMLELNLKYLLVSMPARDLTDTLLTSPGSLFKFTNKFSEKMYKMFGKELSDPDKLLRPLIDFDTIKVAKKIATSEKVYLDRSFLGVVGAYSDIPTIRQVTGLEVSIFKEPVTYFLTAVRNFILRWETFIKSLQALRQVPKHINIVKLYENDLGKLIEEILKTQKKLSPYAFSKYQTSPSSMLKGVSIDFRKFGTFTAKLKPVFLFINPFFQNLRNFYLFAKNYPQEFAIRYASALSALTAYNIHLQKINAEYKKKYGDNAVNLNCLSAYSLGKNILIPIGESVYQNNRRTLVYLSIPLPETLSAFNTPIANYIAYLFETQSVKEELLEKGSLDEEVYKSIDRIYFKARKNDTMDAIMAYFSLSLGSFSALLNTMITGRAELLSDKTITKESLKDLSTTSQYTQTTPNIAILASQYLPFVSPDTIQTIVRNIPMFNYLLKDKGLDKFAKEKLEERVQSGKSINVPVYYNPYEVDVKDDNFLKHYAHEAGFLKRPTPKYEMRYLRGLEEVIKEEKKSDRDVMKNIKLLINNKIQLNNAISKGINIQKNYEELKKLDNVLNILLQDAIANKNKYLESLIEYIDNYDKVEDVDLSNIQEIFGKTNTADLAVYVNEVRKIIKTRTARPIQ